MSRTTLVVAAILIVHCRAERAAVQHQFVDMRELDQMGTGRLDGVVVGSAGPSEVRDLSIHGDRRPGVSLDAPARIGFRSDALTRPAFRFGIAVRPPDAALTLRLTVNDVEVLEEKWQEERGWAERRIDLRRFSASPLSLELSFAGQKANVMLAHPQLLGESPKRPNVIVYVVDCLRADHVGAYGYELPTTPELDSLARDAVVFEDLNACAPWTKPSTACLFTSLLPTHHQVRTVDDALRRERLTLAEVFRDAGYTTAAWVANPVIDPRVFFFNQGFDRWVDLRSFEERAQRFNIHDVDPDAAVLTRAVLPWLEEHRREAFFLYMHSLDLHYGYRRRPPFDGAFVSSDSEGLGRDLELYDNELAYNDHEIGKLVARLQELDLYEDTILLVTADHGEEFGEHGEVRHGKTLYQNALHIPAILKLPRSRHAGQRPSVLASNIDLAPTLLELVGVERPPEFQGKSLAGSLRGNLGRTEGRVFAELVAPNVVMYAVRDARFKYIKNLVPDLSQQLFDLRADPGETRSLFPEPPDEASGLVTELERFVQLGQYGTHLSVRGTRAETMTRVEIHTEAQIVSALRFSIATGDVLDVAADKKHLSLTFVADGRPRHLVVQTVPVGADLRLAVSSDGRPLPTENVELGANGETPGAMPVTLETGALEVDAATSEGFLHDDAAAVRAWYVPPTFERVELDDETLGVMKALGYIP